MGGGRVRATCSYKFTMTFKTFLYFSFNHSIKEINLKPAWECVDNHFITEPCCMISWKACTCAPVYSFIEDKWYSLNVTAYCKENRAGLNP